MSSSALRGGSAVRTLRCTCSNSNRAATAARRQARRLHSVPPLTNLKTFSEEGIGQALSPGAFDLAWTQNQAHLVQKLNELTAGTKYENLTTRELLILFARQPDKAAFFNYASMAHNNHFFFAHLAPKDKAEPPSPFLQSHIDRAFSSTATFRDAFVANAGAMFGPGFTWLVARKDLVGAAAHKPPLAILNTYLAGSPYPQAHYRAQAADANTADGAVAGTNAPTWALRQQGEGRSAVGLQGFGAGAAASLLRGPGGGGRGMVAPGGQDLQVLMCLSTWEHVWLPDYGVGGKREYLERIWEHIDWSKVEANWSERPKGGRF